MAGSNPKQNQIDVVIRRSGLRAGQSGALRTFTQRVLNTAVAASPLPHCTLAVLFCDRAEIRRLNLEFRGLDEETDVLSFPATEDPLAELKTPPAYAGDLAVCLPYTAHGAAEAGRHFVDEVALLLVHGWLHLIGYDHDTAPKKKAMWKETERILALLDRSQFPNLACREDI
jgi:probable rRNA maturation factor